MISTLIAGRPNADAARTIFESAGLEIDEQSATKWVIAGFKFYPVGGLFEYPAGESGEGGRTRGVGARELVKVIRGRQAPA